MLIGIAATADDQRRHGHRHPVPRRRGDRCRTASASSRARSVTGLGMTGGASDAEPRAGRHGAAARSMDASRSRSRGSAPPASSRSTRPPRRCRRRSRRSPGRRWQRRRDQGGHPLDDRVGRSPRGRGRAGAHDHRRGSGRLPTRWCGRRARHALTTCSAMTDGRIDYGLFETLDIIARIGLRRAERRLDARVRHDVRARRERRRPRLRRGARRAPRRSRVRRAMTGSSSMPFPGPAGVEPDGRPAAEPRRRREFRLLPDRPVRCRQQPDQHDRHRRRRHERARRERLGSR